MRRSKCLLSIIFSSLVFCDGLRHHLNIKKDDRSLFKIEDFGFLEGGTMKVVVNGFGIYGKNPFKTGFLLKKNKSESSAQQDLEKAVEHKECIIDELQSSDIFVDMSNQEIWSEKTEFEHVIPAGEEGLYSLIFVRCLPQGSAVASFHLDATFYNPGPSFLPAGDAPLPNLFFACFSCFVGALAAWMYNLRKNQADVQKVHHMMSMLLIFKVLTLLFESIRYHYIDASGASELWSIIYFTFAFLKGIMLFVVILLVGTGWSMVKPYLNVKEKRIIFIVLCLQVIDNIVMVILEESAPGSQGWLTWRDILHLIDIICCCAVLFPIVWSIRHLKDAAGADGKASAVLTKLQMFRQFYIMVIAYIYFTRIVVFLIAATMPFKLLWLRYLFSEAATLAFYCWTGYKFRPTSQNPYLQVKSEDEDDAMELSEFGLEDAEAEIQDAKVESANTNS
mmetsp:Transcript_305/g.376  ORF Transcript_305/g.376 Transcript_305/m.376 type:complete len:449 (-) Transcript_305:92-1438(-)